jgi:NAD-dependent deacetylase
LPQLTLSAGGAVAIVTESPTPLDDRAAVKLTGDVVAELDAVALALAA